jgi:metacaspase-1
VRQKYALTVGINEYADPSVRLRGCVNDARDWAQLLRAQGYATNTLLDSQATQANIVSALVRMVALAGFGDRVVFQYSGHGTWLPDRDGDEADGRDEALVCYDYREGGLLLDDTLQKIFGNLKRGAGALILSDSCHSGTVSRMVDLRRTPPGAPMPLATAKFLSPAEFLDDLPTARAVEMEQKAAGVPRKSASLISGCADLEFSYDSSFNGRSNGAFTRAAIDAFTPGISLKRWYDDIRRELPNAQYPQAPQLTASAYRRYAKAL